MTPSASSAAMRSEACSISERKRVSRRCSSFRLSLLGGGKVLSHADHPVHLAGGIARRKGPITNPTDRAIGSYDAILFIVSALDLPRQRRLQNPVAILGVNGLKPGGRHRILVKFQQRYVALKKQPLAKFEAAGSTGELSEADDARWTFLTSL
jgi:hypothetical protein